MELQSSNWLLHFLTGQEDIVEYLKKIEPGRIVLLASYDDVAPKWVLFWEKAIYISHNPSLFFFQCLKSFGRMTDEMRDILAGMGSTLIKTVKSKDSWVFAGRAATGEKSLFEKVSDHVDCNSLCSFRGQWKPFILIYSSESKKKKKKEPDGKPMSLSLSDGCKRPKDKCIWWMAWGGGNQWMFTQEVRTDRHQTLDNVYTRGHFQYLNCPFDQCVSVHLHSLLLLYWLYTALQ